MKTKKNFVKILLFFLIMHGSALGMLQKILVGFGLAMGSGALYDYSKREKLDVVDMSTPSCPTSVEVLYDECTELDVESLSCSPTKNQLEQDVFLTNGPIFYAKSWFSKKYNDVVDATLFSHFWVFDSVLRKKLSNFVMRISCDEQEQVRRGNISFVHGTNHGISILLRTVFDEVFKERSYNNFVKLRDDETEHSLQGYHDVHEYFDQQIQHAPKQEVKKYNPAGCIEGTGQFLVLFDKGVARDHLVSANFGFFGQSSWLAHGYKESSAEFFTTPCSCAYQSLNTMMSLGQMLFANPLAVLVVGYKTAVRRDSVITDISLLDSYFKGFDDRYVFENIFKAYGVQELYPHYQNELAQMRLQASAGLVQFFIPEVLARRWCYVSEPLGMRASSDQRAISHLDQAIMPYYQARILMHPEVCNPENVSMRFYLLGNKSEIEAMTERMYEIAQEVKDYANKQ